MRAGSAKRSCKSLELGRSRMREAFVTQEMHDLRTKAYENLENLGYFDKANKQLQGFDVSIRNEMYGFDNPTAPEFIKIRVTTTQEPTPMFVITRDVSITGKRFDANKARYRFCAGTKKWSIFSESAGYPLHVADYKKVLEILVAFDKAPVRRPAK